MNRIEIRYMGCRVRFNLEDRICMIRCEAENYAVIAVEALREYCRNNSIDCRYAEHYRR